MPHDHAHSHDTMSDRRLVWSLLLNLLLTVVEVAAGLISGSLALVADAVHNLSDCGSFVIAIIARRIGRRPSDERRTFGYRRAEIIGALVNLTLLVGMSLLLIYEAVERLFTEQEVEGSIVIATASAALVVNLATAILLHSGSRHNLNVRAAYLHNLGDSLSSAGVIVSGALILWFDVIWSDAVVTILVSLYILFHSIPDIRRSIHTLMQGAPANVNLEELLAILHRVDGVLEIHHLHIWELDEHQSALEAHVVVEPRQMDRWIEIKTSIKSLLAEQFHIHHSTLELESPDEAACNPCAPVAGQQC